jgi:hypothetical protein
MAHEMPEIFKELMDLRRKLESHLKRFRTLNSPLKKEFCTVFRQETGR